MNSNLYLRLKSLYPSFHRVEKKIALFIIENKEIALKMTIKQIAEQIDVAESSIIRFSKIMGYSGFNDFKFDLTKSLYNNGTKSVFEDINIDDDIKTTINKIFGTSINTLKETLNVLDFESIEKAVNILLNAEKIIIFGIGPSATLAQACYYRFKKIDLPVEYVVEPYSMVLSSNLMNEKYVAFSISHSGNTKLIVECMKVAKLKEASTICLTSFTKSKLTDVSDIKLVISANETHVMSEAISSRIAHTAVIDSLYVSLALKLKDNSFNKIDKFYDTIDDINY